MLDNCLILTFYGMFTTPPPKKKFRKREDQIFLRGTKQVKNKFYTFLNDDLRSARLSVCVV